MREERALARLRSSQGVACGPLGAHPFFHLGCVTLVDASTALSGILIRNRCKPPPFYSYMWTDKAVGMVQQPETAAFVHPTETDRAACRPTVGVTLHQFPMITFEVQIAASRRERGG